MATIRSFTSLEQSRKLAEILPLESADMSWVSNGLGKPFARTIPIKGDPEELCGCWSLAALLDIIPCGQVNKIPDSNKYEASSWNDSGLETPIYATVEEFDNPVDACYSIIINLHELNLL